MKIKWILLMIVLFYSCDPFADYYSDIDEVVHYQSANISTDSGLGDGLRVMTWNVKFGGARIDFWFDCYGERVHMTSNEVIANLEGLAAFINDQAPDILLLQEVDVNSKRCAYIDQLQWLLDNTHFNYAVYASQWQNQYVPSDGIGPIDSGNAILSRWQITDAERIELDLRTDQDAMTRYFYLKRNILKTKIDIPGMDNFWALNIHTSAYSQDGTKRKQLDRFKDELDAINLDGAIFVAGGDFNTIPPTSNKTSGFQDSVCEDEDFQADDYSHEVEEGWINDFYFELNSEPGYYPAITLADYGTSESEQRDFYTHTTQDSVSDGYWTRKLDYLFTNNYCGWSNSITHQNTMELSDHAPLSATLVEACAFDQYSATSVQEVSENE